jgi:hypothetical protein
LIGQHANRAARFQHCPIESRTRTRG